MPRIALAAALLVSPVLWALPALAVSDSEIRPDWTSYPGLFSPGNNGIVTADLDRNGTDAFITTGISAALPGGSALYGLLVVDWRQADGYQIRHIRRLPGDTVIGGSIVSFRTNAGEPRIAAVLMGTSTSRLVQFAGPGLHEVASVAVPYGFRLNGIADVDGLPGLEAIGCACLNSWEGPGQLLSVTDGSVLWTGTTPGVWTQAGQLDADPALEIVVSGSLAHAGTVLDGATRAMQWSWPDGFDGRVFVGDFRSEGTGNEVAIVTLGGMTTFFATTPVFSPIAQIHTAGTASANVADLDGDGTLELATGATQWGNIRVYRTQTGEVLHTVTNPEHGTPALALARMGPDAAWKVMHAAGLTSSGRDILQVADVATGTSHWIKADEAGPHSSVAIGRTAADGSDEAIFLTHSADSGYGGHNLVILDPATGIERRRFPSVLEPWGGNTGASVAIAQLDADPQHEILVGSDNFYDAKVRAVDPVTMTTEWTSPSLQINLGENVRAMTLLPGATAPRILAVADRRLSVLSPTDGSLLWQSIQFATNGDPTLAVGNLDADTASEIAFGTGSLIRIIDTESWLVEATIDAGTPIIGQRIEGSGASCRHVLVFANRLERRLCMSGVLDTTRLFPIPAATYVGFTSDSGGPLVLSDGNRAYLDTNGQIVGRSAMLGSALGWRNRGAFTVSGDTVNLLIGGLDSVQRLQLRPLMFGDSFEAEFR